MREQYLQALGVEVWTLRTGSGGQRRPAPAAAPVAGPIPEPGPGSASGPVAAPPAAGVDEAAWESLRAQVSACTRCGLCKSRTQTVFGVGDRRSELLVVGEAPGAEEDRRGEPFVGRAGQLLDSMLRAMGRPRETVYIANVLKCRPPGNRDPEAAEVASCLPYLQRQIELLSPRMILVVGRIAAQNLLGTSEPIGRLRGRMHRFGVGQTPVIVTYHPAYLLRSPAEKRRAWADLKLARTQLAQAQRTQMQQAQPGLPSAPQSIGEVGM
jgi:DNA polymerase